MILVDVRNYVRERNQVSLSDILLHFDTDAETARGMLMIWINKGKMHKRMATASCGSSCSQCESAATEIYAWGKTPAVDLTLPPGCSH